ncbi:MAG: hypothetical protein IJO40_05150 [Thermoguttaceae bacterium]|nr:hypothetical protein [Thermoguttaceae bacterium]
MKEYEGKIEFNLTANVAVEGKDREDAKRKLKRLQDRLVDFLKREVDVDVVLGNRFESYVYTDESWKPTPRRDDERYLVYEREGDREYFEEYYDGDQSRIEDAVKDAEEAEWELLKEIEVGEIYFKERFRSLGQDRLHWRSVRKDSPGRNYDDKPSDGDLVDALFEYGVDYADAAKIYVDMKTGALLYDFGMRVYELVEAERVWEEDEDGSMKSDYSYLNERKLGPKVYAHFMGQDAADEAFRHLNEGVATHA